MVWENITIVCGGGDGRTEEEEEEEELLSCHLKASCAKLICNAC